MADSNPARMQDVNRERLADALDEYATRLREGGAHLQHANADIEGQMGDYVRVRLSLTYTPQEGNELLQSPVEFHKDE